MGSVSIACNNHQDGSMNRDIGLQWHDLPPAVLSLLRQGSVIPAHPLALAPDRQFDKESQRALSRYYLDAGSGGLAVGVHSTQFAIRDVGLYRPVLELAAETAASWAKRPLALVAGLGGATQQAITQTKKSARLGLPPRPVKFFADRGPPRERNT